MAVPAVFKVERGIPIHKLHDHYAILGLPLTADSAQIRARYLSIVKILHPDVFGRTPEQKLLATGILSKMVNPAYQILNNERERNEYLATLRLLGKSLQQKQEIPQVTGELPQRLLKMPHEYTYTQYIQQLAEKQYEVMEVETLLKVIGDLSELNLVFISTQQNLTFISTLGAPTPAATVAPTPAPAPPPPKPKVSPAQRNIQMAEILMAKKQWSDALKELQAGSKLDPENARIYGLMGLSYMKMDNHYQAKTFFQKALKLDPKEENAVEHLNKVEAALKASAQAKEKKGGGLFGWGKK
ncbi:MAG: DnaJ domain-containing protein [Pseudanabaenaceae cyanobacterium]